MAKFFRMPKGEKGFTLIEVLVALAIMSMVAAIFLLALVTAGKSVLLAQERTTAESIARSQMEYIKQQGYKYDYEIDDGHGVYATLDLSEGYSNFSIWSVSEWDDDGDDTLVTGVVGINWITSDVDTGTAAGMDNGLQRIELVIKHGTRVVLTLEGYMVDR